MDERFSAYADTVPDLYNASREVPDLLGKHVGDEEVALYRYILQCDFTTRHDYLQWKFGISDKEKVSEYANKNWDINTTSAVFRDYLAFIENEVRAKAVASSGHGGQGRTRSKVKLGVNIPILPVLREGVLKPDDSKPEFLSDLFLSKYTFDQYVRNFNRMSLHHLFFGSPENKEKVEANLKRLSKLEVPEYDENALPTIPDFSPVNYIKRFSDPAANDGHVRLYKFMNFALFLYNEWRDSQRKPRVTRLLDVSLADLVSEECSGNLHTEECKTTKDPEHKCECVWAKNWLHQRWHAFEKRGIQLPYEPQAIERLIHSGDTDQEHIFGLLAPVAIIASKLMDHLYVQSSHVTTDVTLWWGACKRTFRLYALPRFLRGFSLGSLEVNSLRLLMMFHPYAMPSVLFKGSRELRKVFTGPEIEGLCSVVEITPELPGLAPKTKLWDSANKRVVKDAKGETVMVARHRSPYQKRHRGYFLDWAWPSGHFCDLLANYRKFLVTNYFNDMHERTETKRSLDSLVLDGDHLREPNEQERQEQSHVSRAFDSFVAANSKGLFGQRNEFATYLRYEKANGKEQVRYDLAVARGIDLKTDPGAFIDQRITLKEFMSLGDVAQRTLVASFRATWGKPNADHALALKNEAEELAFARAKEADEEEAKPKAPISYKLTPEQIAARRAADDAQRERDNAEKRQKAAELLAAASEAMNSLPT